MHAKNPVLQVGFNKKANFFYSLDELTLSFVETGFLSRNQIGDQNAPTMWLVHFHDSLLNNLPVLYVLVRSVQGYELNLHLAVGRI